MNTHLKLIFLVYDIGCKHSKHIQIEWRYLPVSLTIPISVLAFYFLLDVFLLDVHNY